MIRFLLLQIVRGRNLSNKLSQILSKFKIVLAIIYQIPMSAASQFKLLIIIKHLKPQQNHNTCLKIAKVAKNWIKSLFVFPRVRHLTTIKITLRNLKYRMIKMKI